MAENEMEVVPEIPKDTVEATDLLKQLRKGKKLHDKFRDDFRNQYLISGKLVGDWKNYFKVHIPPDVNSGVCQSLDVKLVEFHQEASFFKAEAEARMSACKSAGDDKYREKYAALVTEYQSKGLKLPAKETLTALSEHNVSDIKNAIVHAEIELSFWKEILNDLSNTRKIVENITINIATEAKALYNEKYIDSINRKKEF